MMQQSDKSDNHNEETQLTKNADDEGDDDDSNNIGQNVTTFEDASFPICFREKNYSFNIEDNKKICSRIESLRLVRKKTVSVALVLCLNIGVEPPGIMKLQPCACMECWTIPNKMKPRTSREQIAKNLKSQYELWQPRARYKMLNDPSYEQVRELCKSFRRNAKEDGVLFHYNGHGVPRPSLNDELWVFNTNMTQYTPLPISELQEWMGSPSTYIYDCSYAGAIINSFNKLAELHECEMEEHDDGEATLASGGMILPTISYKNCIQLGACSENQTLPMNPQLPADLFTSCLTTPIKTFLKWYILQPSSILVPEITTDMIDHVPGATSDKLSMLGELNFIFSSITDTIAWDILPPDLFQHLFRQDMFVASLFRNFLLAERIMQVYDCTTVSSPSLPQTFRHPLWKTWDLCVDLALKQLPDILKMKVPYKQLPFYEEQLDAFEHCLEQGCTEEKSIPLLPILQLILLNRIYRLRALELFARFLDLGPWAVKLGISIGCVQNFAVKLLQTTDLDYKPALVKIWARILAYDYSYQAEIVNDQDYFLSVLQDTDNSRGQRTLSAFVLANIVRNFQVGQINALQRSLLTICLLQINDESSLLRQWVTICLGLLWKDNAKAKWSGARDLAHEKLYALLHDTVPEVRAAAVYALGTYISSVTERTDHANNIDRNIAMTLLSNVCEDMSPIVRIEVVSALQWIIIIFEKEFVKIYLQDSVATNRSGGSGGGNTFKLTHSLERNINIKRVYSSNAILITSTPGNIVTKATTISIGSIYVKIWQGILNLGRDPYLEVAESAKKIIEFIHNRAAAVITAKEVTPEKSGGSSLSLPPSPNTRENYLEDFSPSSSDTTNIRLNHTCDCSTSSMISKMRTFSLNEKTEAFNSTNVPDKSDNNIHEQHHVCDKNMQPIIKTDFIIWAVDRFTKPSIRSTYYNNNDKHSLEFQERSWRLKRNEYIRRASRKNKQYATAHPINTTTWTVRTQCIPSIVKFLPYEQRIAVAYKDKVSVYDWILETAFSCIPHSTDFNLNRVVTSLEAKNKTPTQYTSSSSSSSSSSLKKTTKITRVTALEFINSHDLPLTLIGYDDGTIRVWEEPISNIAGGGGGSEARLLTAWRALQINDKLIKDFFDLVTTWQQQTKHLSISGFSPNIHIWDVEQQLKVYDLPTGSDISVQVLTSSPDQLIAAGCCDGSVRIFDKRCPPQTARIMTYHEHTDSILTIALKDNCDSLVTGCTNGKICIYDIRGQQKSIENWSVGNDVTSIAIHPGSEIIACGGSQYVSIYTLNGKLQGRLRSHEGFIGSRSVQTSCLSFHPYNVMLAGGFLDSTVAVYESSGNKRIV